MDETPAEREARFQEYAEKKERVRRGELCYYCMERPPTKVALHAADGSHLPACDACFERQLEFGKARAKTSTGCLFIGIAILAGVAFAVSRCW
jgi:hypothetical protein